MANCSFTAQCGWRRHLKSGYMMSLNRNMWQSLEMSVSDVKWRWLGVIGSQNTDRWGEECGLFHVLTPKMNAAYPTCLPHVACPKLPHFRHTPLCPMLLAVLRIFNAEGLFHIARCSFSAPFMQALSPKLLHRDRPCIMWKKNPGNDYEKLSLSP